MEQNCSDSGCVKWVLTAEVTSRAEVSAVHATTTPPPSSNSGRACTAWVRSWLYQTWRSRGSSSAAPAPDTQASVSVAVLCFAGEASMGWELDHPLGPWL